MATLHENDDDTDNTTHDTDEVVEHEELEARVEPEVEVVEEGDERLTQESQDDEPSTRRRESAKERRDHARVAKERDKKEIEFQRREIARMDAKLREVQQAQIVSHVTELDNRIATAQTEADTMDSVKAAAIAKNNGVDAVKADNLKQQANDRMRQAQWEKQQLLERANAPQVQAPPYQSYAEEFMAANPWYNHNGSDQDSRIVTEIDNAVAKEFVPTSPRYWQELQSRVAKHFPERYKNQASSDDQDDDMDEPAPKRTKGPPVGGSSRSNSTTTTQIKLSAERVQGLKDAGLWENPKDRMRMAKVYAQYDKDHG